VSVAELPWSVAPQIAGRPPQIVTRAEPDDVQCISVSAALAVIDKPALVAWAANATARAAVDRFAVLESHVLDGDKDGAYDWLRNARFKRGDGTRSATALGTAVHELLCERVRDGIFHQPDDELAPYVASFERWCARWHPLFEAAELTVFSPELNYAGTLDAIIRVQLDDRELRLLVDYKCETGDVEREPYPEGALQLGAYAGATHALLARPARRFEKRFRRRMYLLSPDELRDASPMPPIDGAAILRLSPRRAALYVATDLPTCHAAFVRLLSFSRWWWAAQSQLFDDAIGDDDAGSAGSDTTIARDRPDTPW
jgi:hypothetical protein